MGLQRNSRHPDLGSQRGLPGEGGDAASCMAVEVPGPGSYQKGLSLEVATLSPLLPQRGVRPHLPPHPHPRPPGSHKPLGSHCTAWSLSQSTLSLALLRHLPQQSSPCKSGLCLMPPCVCSENCKASGSHCRW